MTIFTINTPLRYNSWGTTFVPMATRLHIMFNEAIDRQRMKASLGNLSAKDLRDISLTKNEVFAIDQLPLPSCGALDLQNTAKARASIW